MFSFPRQTRKIVYPLMTIAFLLLIGPVFFDAHGRFSNIDQLFSAGGLLCWAIALFYASAVIRREARLQGRPLVWHRQPMLLCALILSIVVLFGLKVGLEQTVFPALAEGPVADGIALLVLAMLLLLLGRILLLWLRL